MVRESVLIVDDSFDMLEVLHRNLVELKFHTYQASNVNDAIQILKEARVDLLITDLQMPRVNGMHLINFCSQHYSNIPILVITGFPSVSGAVEAIKAGAVDYLSKPFTSDELAFAVSKSIELRRLNTVNQKAGSTKGLSSLQKLGVLGSSEPMMELNEMIDRVKDHRATVLIQGESGTGKEMIARAIHYGGRYAKAPFIAVNCGAIPDNLLESELFGFVKGAFTGANETRAGFFQAADGGTIFLDEIGNAPQTVQTRLLRVLQEKEVTMIGATKPQKINLRVIAATNADLMAMVKREHFREDLYYRLNVISIEAPPLRVRKEDIPILTHFFVHKYEQEFSKEIDKVEEKVVALFVKYDWPGNVRELENVVQRLVIMADKQISVADLPANLKTQWIDEFAQDADVMLSLKAMELKHIKNVLQKVGNNKSKAAQVLGIDRKTLRLKLADDTQP